MVYLHITYNDRTLKIQTVETIYKTHLQIMSIIKT